MDVTMDGILLNVSVSAERATKGIRSVRNALKSLKKELSITEIDNVKNGLDRLAAINLDGLVEKFTPLAEKMRDIKDGLESVSKAAKAAKHDLGEVTGTDGMGSLPDAGGHSGLAGNDVSGGDGFMDIKKMQDELKGSSGADKIIDYSTASLKDDQKDYSDKIIETKKETKELARETGKAEKSTNKFLSSLKRIAMYRAIRAFFSAVTNAVKTGISNLYEYSKATNKAFSSVMDDAAASALYFKNSIAAALAPAIESFLPILNRVVDAIAAFNNKIGEMFAYIRGDTYFDAAKRSVESYTSSVKAAKATVLGFDELNILNGDNGNGSSNFGDMFETLEVNGGSAQSTMAILETVLAILSVITAAKVSVSLKNWTNDLKELSKSSLITKGLGLLVTITSMKLAWDAGKNIADAGATGANIVQAVTSAVAGAIGGYMVGGWTGAAIGLGLTIVTGIASYVREKSIQSKQKALEKFMASDAGKVLAELKPAIEEHYKIALDLRASVSSITGDISADDAGKLKLASELLDKIDAINSKDTLNDVDNGLLNQYVNALNDLNLKGVSLEFDLLTGSIIGSTEALRENLKALEHEMQMNAYFQAAQDAMKVMVESTGEYNFAKDAFSALESEFIGNLSSKDFNVLNEQLQKFGISSLYELFSDPSNQNAYAKNIPAIGMSSSGKDLFYYYRDEMIKAAETMAAAESAMTDANSKYQYYMSQWESASVPGTNPADLGGGEIGIVITLEDGNGNKMGTYEVPYDISRRSGQTVRLNTRD